MHMPFRYGCAGGNRCALVLPIHACFLLLVLLPAAIAGQGQQASAGSEACAACHPDISGQFAQTVHYRLATFEQQGYLQGCESCHGAGAKHAESADPKDIVAFRQASAAEVEKACVGCHATRVAYYWKRSDHAMNGVSCVQCHRIHQSRPQGPADRGMLKEQIVPAALKKEAPSIRASLARPETVLCLECHKTVGAKMLLSSRHPVREGKMTCSSCHAVHGSEIGSLKTAERKNDLCLSCHTSKQGPFVFDHEPVSEDCSVCHVAHGSVNNNLLKQNEPFLCLQCHEAHFHIGRAGATTPVSTPTGGSQNPFGESGWRRAFGTKCTQCHVQVHGSNLPSQSVSGRGKTLIR